MATCTHDCSTCGSDCGSRSKTSLIKPAHKRSHIKRVVAVASGKGGVGKSLVTSLLAVRAQAMGYKVGILDADVTGPSVPKAFGAAARATGAKDGIEPVLSGCGVKLISMNSLLEHDSDPVVWRGALIAGAALQFWTDVIWGDLDLLFIDMPPGTGDVPLTVFQSIPLSGVVVVTTPQDLVGMIVEKAVNMANLMNVPLLGLVENESYFICPDCGKKHEIFGKSRAEELAKKYAFPAFAKLPFDPALARLADGGRIAEADTDPLAEVFARLLTSREIKNYL